MNIRDCTSGHGNMATSTVLALAMLAWDLQQLAAVLRLHSRFFVFCLRFYSSMVEKEPLKHTDV